MHEKQREFDFIDEGALCVFEGGKLLNLSGQTYDAVILPSVTAISQRAVDQLHSFVKQGGKVILFGRKPSIIVKDNFVNADRSSRLAWAFHESSKDLTEVVLAVLPKPDLTFEQPCPAIKYIHRRLAVISFSTKLKY